MGQRARVARREEHRVGTVEQLPGQVVVPGGIGAWAHDGDGPLARRVHVHERAALGLGPARGVHGHAKALQGLLAAPAQVVVAQRREQVHPAGQAAEQHGGDAPAAPGHRPRLIAVHDLAGGRQRLDPDGVGPFDMSHHGDRHGRQCRFAAMQDPMPIDSHTAIPLAEVELRTSRSSGPGGQHANVTASRVEAIFDAAASPSLSESQRRRVIARAGARITAVAQDTRSQARNRELALERLAVPPGRRAAPAAPAPQHAADPRVEGAPPGGQAPAQQRQAGPQAARRGLLGRARGY